MATVSKPCPSLYPRNLRALQARQAHVKLENRRQGHLPHQGHTDVCLQQSLVRALPGQSSLQHCFTLGIYRDIIESRRCFIVGTTKLASFAATEEPVECIDYQAPWNPKDGGYQSPAGSSSGSGAAIRAYEWLDIAIGSDSKSMEMTQSRFLAPSESLANSVLAASGSGRRPGHWNGCIAMRPTHGVLPPEGYIPSFS